MRNSKLVQEVRGVMTRFEPLTPESLEAIIAREIDRDPKLLVAVQPTRGLDVGAIEYIHRQIVAQRDAGKAVLLVSFELDEIMSLSDKIDVIFDGRIVASIPGEEATENQLGLLMAGGKVNG